MDRLGASTVNVYIYIALKPMQRAAQCTGLTRNQETEYILSTEQ